MNRLQVPLRVAMLFAVAAAAVSLLGLARPARAADTLILYGDALANGWDNWSWDSTVNFGSTAQIHAGAAAASVTWSAAFAGFSLRTTPAVDASGYAQVNFWLYGGASVGPMDLSIQTSDGGGAGPAYRITPVAGWQEVSVPLTSLGSPAVIARINLQDASGVVQSTFFLDDIRLVAGGGAAPQLPDTTADGSRALGGPSGVAVAPNGRVYAALYPQSRVLSWPSVASMAAANAPDITLGINPSNQSNGDPDTGGCTAGVSAYLLCGPESVAVDSAGNVYVADTYNNRVLIFFDPDTDGSPTAADAVLGQASFTANSHDADSAPGDSIRDGFYFPRGLALDAVDNLYIVDEFNQRVLKYNAPLWGVGGSALPDAVIGQANLNTLGCGCDDSGATATSKFRLPLGVAVDGAGNVYVTDIWNNRVQRFAAPLGNGDTAASVYSGFFNPHDLAVDPFGTLFVSDTKNGKVKAFLAPLTDTTADREYTGLQFPMGLAFNSAGDLFVADCGKASDGNVDSFPPCRKDPRAVLIYAAPPVATPTATATSTATATATVGPGTPTATVKAGLTPRGYLPLVVR